MDVAFALAERFAFECVMRMIEENASWLATATDDRSDCFEIRLFVYISVPSTALSGFEHMMINDYKHYRPRLLELDHEVHRSRQARNKASTNT